MALSVPSSAAAAAATPSSATAPALTDRWQPRSGPLGPGLAGAWLMGMVLLGQALLVALALPLSSRATPLPEEWPLAVPPPQPPLAPQSAPSPPVGTAVRPALLPGTLPQGSPDAPARPLARPAAVPDVVAVADLSAGIAAGPAPALAAASGWLYPLTLEPQEQDPWGWRWSDARQRWRMHTGVDLLVPEGSAVLAAQDGLVLLAEEVSGYGLTVLLAHADGWQTLYAHLSAMAVRSGERIARGQRLGLVGATGNASAPHLHLELRRRQGQEVLAHDPLPLLRAHRPGAALAALP
jgi:murein DD-endopeptidase MepM/ murein hydrolase activator NlpD